mmetsp:Transcript_29339/g.79431  ORF Transcript_29339/g.79431 Transcript_29339/m.79431 type:complete len:296 (-) Transcript_29339:1194-2081(-)
MQRRGTKRVTSRHGGSNLASPDRDDDKKKRKRMPSSVAYILGFLIVAWFLLPAILSPSQKKELEKAEHKVEDYLRQPQTQKAAQRENKQQPPPEEKKKDDDDDSPVTSANAMVDGDSSPSGDEVEGKKQDGNDGAKDDDDDNKADADADEQAGVDADVAKDDDDDERGRKYAPEVQKGADKKTNPNRASSDAASARMAAQSSRWVDGEKALKKKLQVLYDHQMNGKYLGVPVLTRYLGEDIPAFVGTPDSPMKEDEWKKLVEAKYEEMRLEEEEWKKEMAKLVETRERNIGITTA